MALARNSAQVGFSGRPSTTASRRPCSTGITSSSKASLHLTRAAGARGLFATRLARATTIPFGPWPGFLSLACRGSVRGVDQALPRQRRVVARSVVCVVAAGLLATHAARAQTVRAPEVGGRTVSLGQPPQWHWQMGLGAGAFFGGTSNELMIRAWGGGYHASMNPVTKLVELGLEGYVGASGNRVDGGTRALLQVPYLSAGIGPDYNFRRGRVDLLLTVHTPVRRGGFLTRGTMLRLDWYPTLGHSFLLGVSAPLHDPLAGRNRPLQDYVVVAAPFHTPEAHVPANSVLRAELDSLAESAASVRRLIVPFLDQDGRNDHVALARTQRYIASLRTHLAVRSAEDEVRFFHAQMEHAFTVAAGSAGAGRELARKKRNDTLKALGVAARGRFSRWVTSSGLVPVARTEDVLFVFERLTDILEIERSEAAKEWDDPRLVWLPLQYHWELLRMIRETRTYHVLWIHDFPALTAEGTLDGASLTQVIDGYLTTLAERVETYDSTQTLPLFFIFLDQHYYEGRKSRLLMTILEDPLHADGQLGSPTDALRLGHALDRL